MMCSVWNVAEKNEGACALFFRANTQLLCFLEFEMISQYNKIQVSGNEEK
jgi:hypothetical protein